MSPEVGFRGLAGHQSCIVRSAKLDSLCPSYFWISEDIKTVRRFVLYDRLTIEQSWQEALKNAARAT